MDSGLNVPAQSINSLEKWRSKEWEASKLHAYYKFSPEWEACWADLWELYDALESARKRDAAPRLGWQSSMEDHRREIEDLRKFDLRPMKDHLWHLTPLFVFLDRFSSSETRDRGLAWSTALQNWEKFRRLAQADQCQSMTVDPTQADTKLLDYLSPTQRSSYQVLVEWWSSSYCSISLVDAAKSHIRSMAESSCVTDPLSSDERSRVESRTMTKLSLYHSYCYELWLHEFHPHCWEPHLSIVSLKKLQKIRQQAVAQAVCQRLASTALPTQMSSIPGTTDMTAYAEPIRDTKSRLEAVPVLDKPFFLWDALEGRTVTVGTLESCPPYTCISHTWGRWRKDSSLVIPGVPWPVPENTRYDIGSLPKWLAGLMDDSNKGGNRYIWFDLFCIPQEGDQKRMDIEISIQADIFRGAERCIAWLNHFHSWKGVRAALRWISLRFLKTTTTLPPPELELVDAELNRATEHASGSVELMQFDEIIQTMLDDMEDHEQRAWRLEYRILEEPVGWFSSLWTLQEAVLCPNLELCCSDWETLSDGAGFAISLTTLMIFLDHFDELCWPDTSMGVPFTDPGRYYDTVANHDDRPTLAEKYPEGVQSMLEFRIGCRLEDVLTSLSPMSVLTNSVLREYTGERAPGIMSAIGVTDWFLDRDCHAGPDGQKVVLDMFPLAFLQEAARKIGAYFYGGRINSRRGLGLEEDKRTGTMLPFSKRRGFFADVDHFYAGKLNLDMVDHEAVSEWQILESGGVEMHSVGIAASSDMTVTPTSEVAETEWLHLKTSLKEDTSPVPSLGDSSQELYQPSNQKIFREKDGNLVDQLRSIERNVGKVIYAVALYHDSGKQHGILLRGREGTASECDGFTQLVKIGSYYLVANGMPPSINVRWVVC